MSQVKTLSARERIEGLLGAGVQQGSGHVFHIGPHIVPCGGQLRFFQIKAEKAESYYCLKPVREG